MIYKYILTEFQNEKITYIDHGSITKYLNQHKQMNDYGFEIKNKQPICPSRYPCCNRYNNSNLGGIFLLKQI
jgi:hypothetical protein